MTEEATSYLSAARIPILEPGRLIMDPAMLKLISVDKLRDITVIAMRANLVATEAHMKAQQSIIEELQQMEF